MNGIEMTGVREYAEEMPVQLAQAKNGRFVIDALNEAGHNGTSVDVLDVLTWLHAHSGAAIDIIDIMTWLRKQGGQTTVT